MSQSLASEITSAASRQTYYTIRFLVDEPRRADVYRAYAYFRLVDDVLDGTARYRGALLGTDDPARERFLERQVALLDRCLRGDPPANASRHEQMLVDLVAPTVAPLEKAGPDDDGPRARGPPATRAEYEFLRCVVTTVWLPSPR